MAGAYGVWHRFGVTGWNIARPAVFLVDAGGRIRYTYVAEWQSEYPDHETIVEALEQLTHG